VARPSSSATPAGGASVSSARRVLDVLDCFTKDRHTLSSKELAELTGIALPSVYRYITLLRDAGYLAGDDRGNYHLSMRLIGLAQAAEAADDLVALADPVMRELAAATGETVLLVRLVSQAAVCVHRIESSHRLRLAYEPGQPLSLEHGASARLLLSSVPAQVRAGVLADVAAEDPAAAERLAAEVELAQQRGWATSQEEIDPGIWAASAAVRDPAGRTVAVVSVPSPLVRATDDVRVRVLGHVRDAAQAITAAVAPARG